MKRLISFLLAACCAAPAAAAQPPAPCAPAKKGARWGCTAPDGKTAIPFEYEALLPFSGGAAPAKKGGRWGLLRANGDFAPARYDEIYDFTEGLARMRAGKLYGYLDAAGREVLPAVYDEAFPFGGGFATARLRGRYGFINRATLVFKARDFIGIGRYSGGLAPAQSLAAEGRCGYIDAEGREKIPFVFALCGPFDEGFAPAAKDLKGGWGYIGTDGKELTPFKYSKAGPFSGGRARVSAQDRQFFLGRDGAETPVK